MFNYRIVMKEGDKYTPVGWFTSLERCKERIKRIEEDNRNSRLSFFIEKNIDTNGN